MIKIVMSMKKVLLITLSFWFLMGFSAIFAQSTQISGVVMGANDKSPIPGVSVSVKGTSVGTITDVEGEFKLSVPAKSTSIVFSFVGMKTQEFEIADKTTFSVLMEDEAFGMDEVIVMGYTSRKRNELTGSSVQVSGADLENAPVASIDQALQGKIAGVSISSSSGTPGSMQNIRVRGVSSITSNNEPLYVIDGVPVMNDDISGSGEYSSTLTSLASLNPNNVESITVLKDASATAAYGARGSNGVIVITTKQGKEGKTNFNFSTTLGMSNDAVDGYDVLTGAQWSELYKEATGEDSGWDGTNTDWGDLVTNKNALLQTYDLSARGGDEKSTFFASFGYNKSEATVNYVDFEKYTGQINVSRNLNKKLKFRTINSGSSIKQDGFLEQSAYYSNPYSTKYFIPSYVKAYNEDGSIYLFDNNETSNRNTLYTMKHNINRNTVTRIMSNNSLTWDIIKNLSFKTNYSLDYSIIDYKQYNNPIHGDGESTEGDLYQISNQLFSWVTQNSLNYKINKNDHRFDISLIQEYERRKKNSLEAEGTNFAAEGLTTLSSVGSPIYVGGIFEDIYRSSFLALVNYAYANLYYLDFTIRTEGSSKFAEGNRFGTFWSVGGAWNIKNENFLNTVDALSTLRLHTSFGLNGNDGIDANKYQALLTYDANYGGDGGSYSSQFGNENLQWERNQIIDFGLEFGVFNNKISGSAGYYNRRTYDLLLEVPLSFTTGHDVQTQNVGEMKNHGFEFELNMDIIRSDDFYWNIGGNFATVSNEVTKMNKNNNGEYISIETTSQMVNVGLPAYSWYMRKYAGVDTQTGNPLWYVNGKDGETTNDYGSAKKAYQNASALPKYSGSVNTHAEYKGIYLDASLYFAGGHKVYEDWAYYTHHATNSILYDQGVDALMNRWQQPGDITDVPRVGTDEELSYASSTSTRFLYDGDYMRLKNLTLGYSLPKSIVSKIGFSGIKAFIQGTNLLTWVKDDRLKYDPEVSAEGFTKLSTPPVKTVLIGFNFNF